MQGSGGLLRALVPITDGDIYDTNKDILLQIKDLIRVII